MTPYHVVFLPVFLLGCSVAAAAAFLAARSRGWVVPLLLIGFGTCAIWAALFIGSDMGYRNWQAMADPPEEAFSDASVVGALLAGWIPGGFFSLAFFTTFRLIRWVLGIGKPTQPTGNVKPIETYNPYQPSGE